MTEDYIAKFNAAVHDMVQAMQKANDGKMVGVALVALRLDNEQHLEQSTAFANFSMTPDLMMPVFDALIRSTVDANIKYFVESQTRQESAIISLHGKPYGSH